MAKRQTRQRPQTENERDPPIFPDFAATETLNQEHRKMLGWLRGVRFRRVLFGGVDEADVWRKIGELNALYEAALRAERAMYDALLETGAAPRRREDEGDG